MASDIERKGYLIAVDEITDMERFTNEYLLTAAETIDDYDGEVLVGSFDPEVIEGEWDHSLTVVVEFPSVETVKEWYNDKTYQKLNRFDTTPVSTLICSSLLHSPLKILSKRISISLFNFESVNTRAVFS